MVKESQRPEALRRQMADARYSEIPDVCVHCKNRVSVGNQFDSAGWTCPAFPVEILHSIINGGNPHITPFASQVGTDVYDPIIYTEEHAGREWHYTADGDWRYVDGGPK